VGAGTAPVQDVQIVAAGLRHQVDAAFAWKFWMMVAILLESLCCFSCCSATLLAAACGRCQKEQAEVGCPRPVSGQMPVLEARAQLMRICGYGEAD